MAYADTMRIAAPTIEIVAGLIDGIGSSGSSLAWTTFSPGYSGSGTLTYTTVTTNYAKYIQLGKLVVFVLRATGTTAGSGAEIFFNLPVTAAASNSIAFYAQIVDASATPTAASAYQFSTSAGSVLRYDSANWGTGASRQIRVSGVYEAA